MRYLIKPQLAQDMCQAKVSSLLKKGRYIIEPKLDGHRAIVTPHGVYSRQGKIMPTMSHLCDHIPTALEGFALDGELVAPYGSSHNVSHLRVADPKSLKFHIFDIQNLVLEEWNKLTLKSRKRMLGHSFEENPYMEVVPYEQASEKAIRARFLEAQEQGLEGIMIKNLDMPYKEKSRCRDWIKLKVTATVDVVITDCDSKPSKWRVPPGGTGSDGVYYPEGLHTSTWKAGHVGLSYGYTDSKGKIQRVGSLGWTGHKEDIEKFVGRVAEIKHYGVYNKGKLRHPVFLRWRTEDDKCASDCTVPKATI